jgi:hypothetical protein
MTVNMTATVVITGAVAVAATKSMYMFANATMSGEKRVPHIVANTNTSIDDMKAAHRQRTGTEIVTPPKFRLPLRRENGRKRHTRHPSTIIHQIANNGHPNPTTTSPSHRQQRVKTSQLRPIIRPAVDGPRRVVHHHPIGTTRRTRPTSTHRVHTYA